MTGGAAIPEVLLQHDVDGGRKVLANASQELQIACSYSPDRSLTLLLKGENNQGLKLIMSGTGDLNDKSQ